MDFLFLFTCYGRNFIMRNCVLIIEHDPSVSRFMQLKLEEEGFSCLIDNTGEAAVDLAGQRQVDLILLDPDEPLKGGHEILGKVREISSLPIIYLSSDTSVDAKVEALNAGADDYMTKPFGIMELLSRVKALLRRSAGAQTKRLEVGNLVLDDERHLVMVKGENCELTFKEYELLKLLIANCGMVLTREVIMERVWGTDFEGESRTLDMHIKTLRQKLGEEGSMIRTVRNVGYLLEKD